MARQVLDHGVIIPAEYSDDWYEDMSTNLEKLDEVIGSDAGKLSEADVSNVALSGDYDDLTNKPELKPVATSGDYDDLTNKPDYGILRMTSETLSDSGSGAISNLNSDSKLAAGDYVLDAALKVFPITAVSAPNYTVGTSLFQITNASALAAVATSGSYDDLNNLPAYGITRFVNAAITDNSNVAFANISSVDKIKAGDFLLDNAGKMYLISSVDSVNETAAVTTPLTVLALDANVMHLSGDETVAGIKTFSDDTFVKSLNFTREVASPSSSNVAILPIIATITYSDQSPSQSSTLNLRISADGSKTLYPNENGVYSLGMVSRNWDNVFSYMFEAFGKSIGNEFSNNARTNLYLKANRDTSGQSGVYVSKFRQNRAQGSMSGTDVVQVTFDVLENSVRSNRLWYLNWIDWENDIPKTVEVRSLCEKVDYKLTHINGINPGSLSLPDTSNSIDISGYITDLTGSVNTYTALADGYVSIRITGTAMRIAVTNGVESSSQRSSAGAVACYVPVVAGETVSVYAVGTGINNAIFRPCKGNV